MDKEQILDLILFLKDKEYNIVNHELITVWIEFDKIQKFIQIFGYSCFCEGDIEVTLLENCIAFNLYDFIEGAGEATEYIIKKLKEFEED